MQKNALDELRDKIRGMGLLVAEIPEDAFPEKNRKNTGMRYEKGQSGNPAGRPSGTPNKTTAELRASLKALLDHELERLPETLESLSPKERLDIVLKLMAYALPKVSPVDADRCEPLDW